MAGEPQAHEKEPKKAEHSAKRLVKWMGDTDVRRIDKGEDFDGQLPGGMPETLQWDWDNNHVLNVGHLPAEVIDLILSEPDLKDVTDLKTIPHNAVFKRRGALGKSGQQQIGAVNPTGVGGAVASGLGTGTGYTGEGSTASSSSGTSL